MQFTHKDGFSGEIVQDVKKATVSLKAYQRWVILLHHEMTIKSDLVCDIYAFKSYATQWGLGVRFPGKKYYEGVRFNVIKNRSRFFPTVVCLIIV